MALTKLQAAVIEGVLGLIWQSPAKTSSFAAAIGSGYYLNTTTGAITVTLPSSPTIGDSIGMIDYAGTAASNNIILTSSNNIQGSSDDKIVNYTRGALRITYADTTQGWVASAAANDGTSALNPSPLLVDFLVVAGGGGSGSNFAGGSGAGGLRTSFGNETGGSVTPAETALTFSKATAYTITVGDGGTGAPNGTSQIGDNGDPSSISGSDITDITTVGGGRGAFSGSASQGGSTGGSGGGWASVSGSGYAGTVGQGKAGGNNTTGTNCGTGGGGGSTGVGVNTPGSCASGGGGAGLQVDIDGLNNFYAGGGGGGTYQSTSTSNIGGSGIGGNGGIFTLASGIITQATSGAANTGSGGGGGSAGGGLGGDGGSGIVILRCTEATATISAGITVNGINVAGSVNGIAISGTSDYHYSATLGTGTITFS